MFEGNDEKLNESGIKNTFEFGTSSVLTILEVFIVTFCCFFDVNVVSKRDESIIGLKKKQNLYQ